MGGTHRTHFRSPSSCVSSRAGESPCVVYALGQTFGFQSDATSSETPRERNTLEEAWAACLSNPRRWSPCSPWKARFWASVCAPSAHVCGHACTGARQRGGLGCKLGCSKGNHGLPVSAFRRHLAPPSGRSFFIRKEGRPPPAALSCGSGRHPTVTRGATLLVTGAPCPGSRAPDWQPQPRPRGSPGAGAQTLQLQPRGAGGTSGAFGAEPLSAHIRGSAGP